MEVANAPLKTSHKFEDMFISDPSAKHHGYKSWDGKPDRLGSLAVPTFTPVNPARRPIVI
jgi:hypothetical protein